MKQQSGQSLFSIARQKFFRNKIGLASFSYIGICILLAFFAYAIIPDHSANANQMELSIHSKRPGFQVDVLKIPQKNRNDDRSFLNELFFGFEIQYEKIPYQKLQIAEDQIKVIPLDAENSSKAAKIIPLKSFEKANELASLINNEMTSFRTNPSQKVLSQFQIDQFFILKNELSTSNTSKLASENSLDLLIYYLSFGAIPDHEEIKSVKELFKLTTNL